MSTRRAAWILILLATLAGPAAADEFLYYVDDGGEVVITNTPSRSDVKPVPGLGERVRAVRANLPPTRFDNFIDGIGMRYGVDPSLIKAVAYVESAFKPTAVSHKGAMGLMQLMPATAARYGVQDAFDPYQNLDAGARHLRDLLDEFRGDTTLALAAYNAGSGAVRRYGGVPAYRETQNYVKKVHGRLGRAVRTPRTSTPGKDPRIRTVVREDGTIEIAN